MNTASEQTLHIIEQIVKPVLMGTNLGLLQLIGTMIRGTFLPARGAVHTALMLAGFKPDEIRRSWQALRYGVWHITELLSQFHEMVEAEGSWQTKEYGGYQPLAVDVTAIWRPRLKSWKQKVYRQLLGKAFIGIGYGLIARVWRHLVRSDLAVSAANETFSVWEIDDPLFESVLLLGTNLPDDVAPQTIYQLYIDRWPVEQIPLVAKQLLGCHRQFVFATVSCWRLGELAFFVGNLLTWLALLLPAFPSGYWDRHPKKRPVALDGSWPKPIIQKSALFQYLRQK